MTGQISFPPLHDPSASELEARRRHLLDEIRREEPKPGRGFAISVTFWPRRLNGRARSVLVALIVVVTALALVPIGGASLGNRALNGLESLWKTPGNQASLDSAAADAQSVAGRAYYTATRVNSKGNTVDVYLAAAPQSLVRQLRRAHPQTYVIHNNAAHSLSVLLKLEHALDLRALKSRGITVTSIKPADDGYLEVGVSTSVRAARVVLDAHYPGFFHVHSEREATVAPHVVGG